MYLLDTNVISEPTKPQPDPKALAWLADVDEDGTFVSTVTFIELRYRAERLSLGRRRRQLEGWLDGIIDRFVGRTLAVDINVANAVGQVMVRLESAGRRTRGNDVIIAGTALVHELTVVTRNVKDFAHTGVEVFNPWESTG